METEFDREKFKDAMHYVIAKAGGHAGFGATKLYKILWFSDARMYVLHDQPIYNAEFVRDKHGPRPKLGMQIREELVSEGRVKSWEDNRGSYKQWQFRSLQPPSTTRFNRDELQTLDYWIKHIDQDHTAASISEETHDYAWDIADMGEPLPLYAILAARLRDPTEEEMARARKRLAGRGLF